MPRIYMDANATTPVLPEVVEAMVPFWSRSFGNASSVHTRGQQARAAVEHARDEVAGLLNCRPTEVVFTSGGTESDNLALFGAVGEPRDVHLVTSAIEHHAVLHAAVALAERGAQVVFLQPNGQGVIEPAALREALKPDTRLVSIMLANNETGVLQPVQELAEIAHSAGALFHCDAVQGAGKMPIDVRALGVDLLSISGHKMHGPQGIGVLFVRTGVNLQPIFFGGMHERSRRPGTENVAGIVGLGKAAELAREWLVRIGTGGEGGCGAESPEALAGLRDRLEQGILARVPEAGVNGTGAPRVANTANLYFVGVDGEALVIALDLQGLEVSMGSACQSGATDASHVLLAMGVPESRARASVRFSLSRMTQPTEIERVLDLVPTAVARLRDLASAPTGA